MFNSGLLADPRPRRDLRLRRRAGRDCCSGRCGCKRSASSHGVPLRAAALRFPLGHPAVASVLVGLRSAEEARDAAEMIRHQLPEALWAELRVEGLLPESVPVPVSLPVQAG